MNRTPGTWVPEMYSMPTGADDFDCGASVWADDGTRRREVAFVKELPEQEANVRLIAAAPDLLEALKECAPALARFGYDSESVRKAYDAIAKAEGKEPAQR